MRMRPHVHAGANLQLGRAELVDEDERPDHRPAFARKGAADLELAEIVRHRLDRLDDGHTPSPGAMARIASA